MYTLEGKAGTIGQAAAGVELAGVRRTASGIRAEAVLTRSQRAKLRASGVGVKLTRNRKGQTVQRAGRCPAAGGFNVWRSWDEPGGIRDELFDVARRNPQLVKLEVLGTHPPGSRADRAEGHPGRPRRAGRLTPGGALLVDPARPRVDQPEVNRRLLHHFIDRWRANDKEIKRLLKRTELWFVIVANPDGYQYTFDTRAPVAQEPARQQRRRPDHRRRRRRPEPQLRRALGLRQRGLVARPGGRDLPRAERGLGARDAGACRA